MGGLILWSNGDGKFDSREAAQEFSPGWSRKAEPWVSEPSVC